MGRPPSNGGPSFRFSQTEVTEMDAILQAHNAAMPSREVLVALAEKFSDSAERSGKFEVQIKQVWNWFQNRRYALRAKAAQSPGKSTASPLPWVDSTAARYMPQAPQHTPSPSVAVGHMPQAPQHPPAPSVQSVGRNGQDAPVEFEAKSARDGAWYDVATLLSHRNLETDNPEVLIRFAGFGPEEDEWVNIRMLVRQRSLPCESSECVAVLPRDLILCFQEGKEQALYFDAHVLDAQRRRHDARGCRCRFLVRYDHDQSEEIVPLRKVCRRPETDYRLQQLHAMDEVAAKNQHKPSADVRTGSSLRVYPPAESTNKQPTPQETTANAPIVVPSASPVTEPEVAEIVTSNNMGNANATPVTDAAVVSDTATKTNVGNSNSTPVTDAVVMNDTPTNTVPGSSEIITDNMGTSNFTPVTEDVVMNDTISDSSKIITSSDAGNSNVIPVPDDVVMSDTATNTISGGTEIIAGSNMVNSNVTTVPDDVVMSDTATNTISGGSEINAGSNMGNSNAT